MSPDGEVEFINNQGPEYFGKDFQRRKVGLPATLSIRMTLPRSGFADWMHSVKTGEPYDVDNRLRGADGVYRWFHTHVAFLLRDADGRIVRWYVLLI